jgi:hypothetical protein
LKDKQTASEAELLEQKADELVALLQKEKLMPKQQRPFSKR